MVGGVDGSRSGQAAWPLGHRLALLQTRAPPPRTRHRAPSAPTWSRVFEDKVLIVELLPVDGLAPCAVVVREIAALAHELGDDAVEATSLKAEALLVGAQASEILWHGERKRCGGQKTKQSRSSGRGYALPRVPREMWKGATEAASEMPGAVEPHGQARPSCFDNVKTGSGMGRAVGVRAGIGMQGWELVGRIGKTVRPCSVAAPLADWWPSGWASDPGQDSGCPRATPSRHS